MAGQGLIVNSIPFITISKTISPDGVFKQTEGRSYMNERAIKGSFFLLFFYMCITTLF